MKKEIVGYIRDWSSEVKTWSSEEEQEIEMED